MAFEKKKKGKCWKTCIEFDIRFFWISGIGYGVTAGKLKRRLFVYLTWQCF